MVETTKLGSETYEKKQAETLWLMWGECYTFDLPEL